MSSPETLSPIEQLIYLMERLRDPTTGCPWDVKQTFKTIAPSTIEEAYEVVDAIENGDLAHLREELGDLLFQVVFYAQMGKEQGDFDFNAIAQAITDKLVRRHPHVFPDGTLSSRIDPNSPIKTSDDVKGQWEAIKKQERAKKGQHRLLDDIPRGLPAMVRAEKLQRRAKTVGFDWNEIDPVLEKLREEVDELSAAIKQKSPNEIEAELGDCLFALVNVARHTKVDADAALRGANKRFSERFNFIEERLVEDKKSLEEASMDEMEQLWNEAKQFFAKN